MSESVREMAGKQVLVGLAKKPPTFSFILPKQGPETDPEIISIEETIAEIEVVMEPYKAVVDRANRLVKYLRDRVTECMVGRRFGHTGKDKDQMALPFNPTQEQLRTRAVRAACLFKNGAKKRWDGLVDTTDRGILDLVRAEFGDDMPVDVKDKSGLICTFCGGKNPRVGYPSGKKGGTILVVGANLATTVRAALDIPEPKAASKRKATKKPKGKKASKKKVGKRKAAKKKGAKKTKGAW